MDFYKIRTKENKGLVQAYPDWVVDRFDDLMVRGGSFYAVWDEAAGMWSTNEFDVQRLVDADIYAYTEKLAQEGHIVEPLITRNFSTGTWERFNRYIRNLPDKGSHHQLDEQLTFANTVVKKKDYVSKRLPYALEKGKTDAWDELIGVLYSPEERDKIEWAIGAIVSGDSKWIQKFLVFYGPPGTGKSTVIDIIEKLFQGYVATFEAKALTSGSANFSMEAFESNPLVALQHDGDMSRIEDNTKLNSIVSHDSMPINVKYRSAFTIRPNAFLIVGTNKPVKITDAKSGNTRRLIDVHPTGVKIEPSRYHILKENINFELGAIAYKCLERYREMGKFYYDRYVPTKMMMLTDSFYNFVEAHFDIFKSSDGIQLKYAWDLYKAYCEEANIVKRLQYHEVRDELHSYFNEFRDRYWIGDKEVRSVYLGFKGLPNPGAGTFIPDTTYVLELNDYNPVDHNSAFNVAYSDQPAQEANTHGNPRRKWHQVDSVLNDIDTTKLHWVKVPEKHIVIDFDLTDENGEKNLEKNIEEASKLPPTYAELSQSGKAIHLHYIYEGDVHELAAEFDDNVEIKTLLGDASLRRKITKCNNLDIATISGGLPKKEKKKMLETNTIKSEKNLRNLIERNLRKEFHAGTKPSIDFIHKILEDAYSQGLKYDVSDMKPVITTFAMKSTNQANKALSVVMDMKWASEDRMEETVPEEDKPYVFFDVEVYPNLFVVCFMANGDEEVTSWINPTPDQIADLMKMKLIGFNCRRYDNHIIYAAYLGYSVEELYHLSQRIIDNTKHNSSGLFGEAYNISYTDIYDFSSKKQGLKKFQIELGIHHEEIDLPWDKPVPEELWPKVVDYCKNDVLSTRATFNARYQDFVARLILADLSGMSVNSSTLQHTAKIIFGDDRKPQSKFVYTDLSEEFPGYTFNGKDSTYHGEVTGEGGYVYAEPGAYRNVALLDVASMHPTSIKVLNLFGPYTERFNELMEARLAIKRKDYEKASSVLDGKLTKFLEGGLDDSEDLAYALKIVINTVYGLTSARFDNPFRDIRNKDNIVAKRGALFMIDLKEAVQDRGFIVAHIKTDSIKIPDATPEIIQFVIDFGKEYGYDFEHETTYDQLLLANDAVYIGRKGNDYTCVGAQFQHPYVYKTLFSHEELTVDDFCEVKSVQKGTMYLDFKGTDDVSEMRFVGRTGSFIPVQYDGGVLWRVFEDKKYHVGGTKDYMWIERDIANFRDIHDDLSVDMDYFETLKNKAIETINQFIDFNEFVRMQNA